MNDDRYKTWPSFVVERTMKKDPEGPFTPHQWEERPHPDYSDFMIADCKVCHYGIMYPEKWKGNPVVAARSVGANPDCDVEVVKDVLEA